MLMNPFLLPLSLSLSLSLINFSSLFSVLETLSFFYQFIQCAYICICVYMYIHIHMYGRTTIHRNSFAFIFVRISDFVSTLARVNVQII